MPLFSNNSSDIKEMESVEINNTILKEELPIFQTYGELPPNDYLDGGNPITEKYGFRFKRVSYCEVDGIDLEDIHQENKKSMKFMNAKYGKGWKKKFEDETNLILLIPLE